MTIPASRTSFHTKQLARYIARVYDAELAHAGMKSTQFTLLTHVLKRESIATGELADLLGVDTSTLTRNLQVALVKHWITVTPGQDSRVRIVELTASGKEAQIKAHAHWLVAQQSLTAILGPDLAKELHDVVRACSRKLRAR